MLPSDFRKIDEHFKSRKIPQDYSQVAYRKFIESVQSGVESSKKQNQKDPTASEMRKICEQSLASPILDSYVELAKIDMEADKNRETMKSAGLGYIGSIIVGLVSNFLFLSILVLVYAFGKDQVEVILQQLGLVGQ